jgi:hypothetical protein
VIADWNLTQAEAEETAKRGPKRARPSTPAALLASASQVKAAPGAVDFWLGTGMLDVS